MKGFFEWFNIKEFMNTYKEWHAFSEGVSEAFCFWKERHEPSEELLKALKSEHHYYTFGRVVGFIGLALFGVFIIWLVRKSVTKDINERRFTHTTGG